MFECVRPHRGKTKGLTRELSGMSEAQRNECPLERLVMRCAALFVQPDGCYAGLPDVDAWPEHRDARRYAGPLPVVVASSCWELTG